MVKVKRIKVEDQNSLEGKIITIKEMEDIKATSDLLNYMNANNWEFIDRKAVTEDERPSLDELYFQKKEVVRNLQ